jgi:hypothetical protein
MMPDFKSLKLIFWHLGRRRSECRSNEIGNFCEFQLNLRFQLRTSLLSLSAYPAQSSIESWNAVCSLPIRSPPPAARYDYLFSVRFSHSHARFGFIFSSTSNRKKASQTSTTIVLASMCRSSYRQTHISLSVVYFFSLREHFCPKQSCRSALFRCLNGKKVGADEEAKSIIHVWLHNRFAVHTQIVEHVILLVCCSAGFSDLLSHSLAVWFESEKIGFSQGNDRKRTRRRSKKFEFNYEKF